jgi:hypothetical protein
MRGMTALVWLGSAVDPDEVNIPVDLGFVLNICELLI